MARTGRPRKHPRPTGETPHFLGVRVPAATVDQLDRLVAAEGTDRSRLIREAIELLLAHRSPTVDEEVAA